VVQIPGVQLSKRKLSETEILAIPGLPGLPDLLGSQPLRLLIGGNNPSEHAWCASLLASPSFCRARLVRQPAWKSVTSYKHCCLSGTSSDIMVTLLQLATGAPGIITATRSTICGDSSFGPALLCPACRALR